MNNYGHLPSNGSRLEPRKLVRLHPREESFEVSQGRTVLTTHLDGSIRPKTPDGLYVHQTRMISCYRWRIKSRTAPAATRYRTNEDTCT